MKFTKITNELFIQAITDDLYLVKEWNSEKEMFYVATYTSDELEMYFGLAANSSDILRVLT